MRRSALRVVVALQKLPGASRNQHLSDFISHIKANNELSTFYSSVQKDSSGMSRSGGGDSNLMEV